MRAKSDWQARYGAAMHRARTIERQAAGLRSGLARVADGEPAEVAERAIAAMRYQLQLAEDLLATWRRPATDNP